MAELHESESEDGIHRTAVPTGWIYTTEVSSFSGWGQAETFVPDPGAAHVLKLAEDRKQERPDLVRALQYVSGLICSCSKCGESYEYGSKCRCGQPVENVPQVAETQEETESAEPVDNSEWACRCGSIHDNGATKCRDCDRVRREDLINE